MKFHIHPIYSGLYLNIYFVDVHGQGTNNHRPRSLKLTYSTQILHLYASSLIHMRILPGAEPRRGREGQLPPLTYPRICI